LDHFLTPPKERDTFGAAMRELTAAEAPLIADLGQKLFRNVVGNLPPIRNLDVL